MYTYSNKPHIIYCLSRCSWLTTQTAAHNTGELKQIRKQTQSQFTLQSVTHYSCILAVITIVNSNAVMGAVSQACLNPSAGHIIIVVGTISSTKVGTSMCTCGFAVTELMAHHVGIIKARHHTQCPILPCGRPPHVPRYYWHLLPI